MCIVTTKTCSRCGIDKGEAAFHWANRAMGRRHSACSECRKTAAQRNPEHVRERQNEASYRHYWRNPSRAARRSVRSTSAVSGRKRCSRCGIDRATLEFSLSRYSPDGLQARCKECCKALVRARTPEQVDRYRSRRYQNRYGISLVKYDALLAAQGGVCCICSKPPIRGVRLAVDHDHRCCPGAKSCGGCVRGLLHNMPCNTVLGAIGDDAETADRIAEYLRRGAAKVEGATHETTTVKA